MEKEATYICDRCKENADASENKSKNYRWLVSIKTIYQCAKCSNYFNIGFRVTDKISLIDASKNSELELIAAQSENVNADEGSRNEDRIQESQPVELKKKPYKCDVCLRTYMTQNSLRHHKKVHDEKNPFRCKVHMKVHKDQNIFRCELCKKSCATKQALERHMRTHSNEKHYKCSICYRKYKIETGLTAHMNVHKEENPYRCELCNKNFSSKTTLKKHMATHSDSIPYKCHIFPSSYKTEFNLIRHIKLKHQQDNMK
ncbi:Zinc finger protein 112 like protein [Argiope bruennichi]|uniref:Zinc finger protein 112 like protein n=1 Tax=Argiope bruennichi TaxID=94029 RepID=A0A8T0EVI8_ARGBR|nr:Zinc finger protein 112 like protein [Argiope bruennichi]